MCVVVTLWLYDHCHPSGNPLPDKMDWDSKVQSPIYSWSSDRSIMTNYDRHKVALSHLRVIP